MVIAPNGGEFIQQLATFDIRWRHDGFAGPVDIAVSPTGIAGPFTTVAANETNDDLYEWTVDETLFPAGGNYIVRVSESANPAITDRSDFAFTIVNDPPAVGTLADVTLDEGAPFSTTVSAIDPEGGALTAVVAGIAGASAVRDGDNFVISWGQTPDGPDTINVSVTVTDSGAPANSVLRSFAVTTVNVAPTLAVSGPATVAQGQPYVLSLDATDAGSDTVASWQINWGDGNVETLAGDPSSASHVYDAPAGYVIQANATDEDGTWSAAPVAVQVDPLPSLAVTAFAPNVSGIDQAEILARPALTRAVPLAGPDPLVSLPQDAAAVAGRDVTVPIELDSVAGLDSVQLRLTFDPAMIELREVRKGGLTANFDWLVDQRTPGLLLIDMAQLGALEAGPGSLLELDLRVHAGVAPGSYRLDLEWASLNDGRLTLSPAPKPGADASYSSTLVRPAAFAAGRVTGALVTGSPAVKTIGAPTDAAPVIDWSAGMQNSAAVELRAKQVGASRPWALDFVASLGQTKDQTHPNNRMKVELPPASRL